MNILETDSERFARGADVAGAEGDRFATEIQERMATTDSASPGQGARMVARAWVDPAYRA